MVARNHLKNRRKRTSRPAPLRPEIKQQNAVRLQRLLKVFGGNFGRGHGGFPGEDGSVSVPGGVWRIHEVPGHRQWRQTPEKRSTSARLTAPCPARSSGAFERRQNH